MRKPRKKGEHRFKQEAPTADTKLARILFERKLSQKQLIALVEEKTGCILTKASVSKYVNNNYKYMTVMTAKILAYSLGCAHLEDVIEGFPKTKEEIAELEMKLKNR